MITDPYSKGSLVRIRSAGDEFDGLIAEIVVVGNLNLCTCDHSLTDTIDCFELRLPGREIGAFCGCDFVPVGPLEHLAEQAE